jgi:hypothetical protein
MTYVILNIDFRHNKAISEQDVTQVPPDIEASNPLLSGLLSGV